MKKIDISERLTESEYKWLQEKQLLETLSFVKQQEAGRRNEFAVLKERYQAICFERLQYSDGEYWFHKAIKRGATPSDTDSEIRSILKKTNDDKQRQELVN